MDDNFIGGNGAYMLNKGVPSESFIEFIEMTDLVMRKSEKLGKIYMLKQREDKNNFQGMFIGKGRAFHRIKLEVFL